MTWDEESLKMHGMDITARCLHMVRLGLGNLTPWLAMGRIRVNIGKCL